MANEITARRRGLKACTDAVERLKTQAALRMKKALEKSGEGSDAYLEAKAEYEEIASTAARWRSLVKGREADLEQAARGA
jgi:hypothetical protein